MSGEESEMPVVYLTRRATFCASHRLHSPELSDEENRRVFGKCNHPNGHGHNYVLEVTVRGEVDRRTGMVMNLTELKTIIEDRIHAVVDHKCLNLDVPAFEDLVPTAENMAVVFWGWLEAALPRRGLLHEIRIQETENNVAIYRGE
jgi:6-pyruvoyltetrahydropterin/6-carboxytetrahydropterin synthase